MTRTRSEHGRRRSNLALRRWQAVLLGLVPVFMSRPAAALLPDGCVALGSALVEHSCFHSTFGPFHSVLATPGKEALATTPNVDAVHTEYRVGLPAPAGANVVTYEPERSGAWSVFLGSDIELSVLDAEGAALPALMTQRGNTGCDALPVAHVFELAAKQRYRVVLGPSAESAVVVVIEYTDDFLVESGPDEDGDGFGAAVGTKVTNCTPEPGYAPNASDCNDQDPAIHPAAAERCDGVDQNCNGSPDDAGLTCRAGSGRCAGTGVYACDAPGMETRCTAVPSAPVSESCNQIDDDCNGAIDDAPALCSDLTAPVCVREGMTAFCGCSIDLDCGGATSGTRCDLESRRCVNGCSTTPGRNGCPDGFVCVVETGGSNGECQPDARAEGGAGGESSAGRAGEAGSTGATPSAGMPGVAGLAGAPSTPPEGGAGGEASEPDPDVIVRTVRDCGCRVPGRPGHAGAEGFAALFVVAAMVLRRRGVHRASLSLIALLGFGVSACGGKVLTYADDGENSLAGTGHSHGASGHSHGASAGSTARGGSAGASGTGASGGGAAGSGPSCTDVVSAIPVEHACSHATNGSLENAIATPSPESSPAVDVIHQTYAVELPNDGAAPGFVSYVASRDGEHLVLTDRSVPVAVRDGAGRLLSPITSGPVSGCNRLTHGVAVTLSRGERYVLSFGPSSDGPVVVFLEHLGTFGDDAWSVRCD